MPPAPMSSAPPPPIRPPSQAPPAPPISSSYHHSSNEKIPSFVQRQERDTFGVKEKYDDSWGRAEAARIDMIYETSKSNQFLL